MTKAPDDQPFEFNADAYAKSMETPDFRFHWLGKRWTLQHYDAVDSWAMAAAQKTGEDEEILKVAMGSEQVAALKEKPIPQGVMKELVKQYFKHSGVDLGKSADSTSS